MPKIRGVKPDYWSDEDIVDLSIPARLLFIGLWNYACDNGHLQDKPKQIKMRVLPGDDVNVSELLRELAAKKRIQRGNGWITVPNLGAHQKIDARYFTTCDKEGCEDPPEKVSQRESRRAHAVQTRAPAVRTPGARGDGEVMVKGSDGDRGAARATTKRATPLPDTWEPNDQHKGFATDNKVNLSHEVDQFRDHHRAKGSTMKDWDAAFRSWLRNAVKWRKETPAAPTARTRPHASQLELPPDGLTPAEYAAWERTQRERRSAS